MQNVLGLSKRKTAEKNNKLSLTFIVIKKYRLLEQITNWQDPAERNPLNVAKQLFKNLKKK